MSSIENLSGAIAEDLRHYFPKIYKNPLKKLSIMVCAMIEAQTCNKSKFSGALAAPKK